MPKSPSLLIPLAVLFLAEWGAPFAEAAPPITAAVFSRDGKSVLVGSQAGLMIHSWPDLKLSRAIKTGLVNVHDLAVSPGGELIIAAGGKPAEEGVIEMIRWHDAEPGIMIQAGADVVHAVDWRSDGEAFAAACGDRLVRLFGRDGKPLAVLEGHSHAVLGVRFVEGKLISAGRDQSVRLWDPESGKSVRSLDNHTAAVNGLAVRPGVAAGKPAWVATVGADRTLRFWWPTVAPSGRLVRFAKLPSEPLAVEWTADGSHAVVACADGHVRIIDPDTASIVKDLPGLEGWAYTLVRSPSDGSFLAAGQNGQMRRVLSTEY